MSWLDEAIAKKPHQTFSPLTVKDNNGENVQVAFERGSRWEGKTQVSHPYVTCWVFKPVEYVYRFNSAGRAHPDHLNNLRSLISRALDIHVTRVEIGFGPDQFDVRPF
jgi:hypothetical protein